jgi:L-lactate dehydrogenase complex protein LldG
VARAAEGAGPMSDARTRILSGLRDAARTARLPRVPDDGWRYAPPVRSPAESVERFLRELEALGVEAQVAATADEVRARVASLVEGRRLLSWDAAALPYDLGPLVAGAARGSSPRDVQAAAEIGLTGCDAAIAETGSLALVSGPGRSRAVSLLPPRHVAVVRRGDVFFSMGEYLAARRDTIAASANVTFVTGPSRTADIELTLTLGVHGPGSVAVVVGP